MSYIRVTSSIRHVTNKVRLFDLRRTDVFSYFGKDDSIVGITFHQLRWASYFLAIDEDSDSVLALMRTEEIEITTERWEYVRQHIYRN